MVLLSLADFIRDELSLARVDAIQSFVKRFILSVVYPCKTAKIETGTNVNRPERDTQAEIAVAFLAVEAGSSADRVEQAVITQPTAESIAKLELPMSVLASHTTRTCSASLEQAK